MMILYGETAGEIHKPQRGAHVYICGAGVPEAALCALRRKDLQKKTPVL